MLRRRETGTTMSPGQERGSHSCRYRPYHGHVRSRASLSRTASSPPPRDVYGCGSARAWVFISSFLFSMSTSSDSSFLLPFPQCPHFPLFSSPFADSFFCFSVFSLVVTLFVQRQADIPWFNLLGGWWFVPFISLLFAAFASFYIIHSLTFSSFPNPFFCCCLFAWRMES